MRVACLKTCLLSTMVVLAVSNAVAAETFEDFHADSIRGANYVPSYARNDVAAWMDYDSAVIDRELGYAERLKLNTVRVFLNQAVYEHDPKRFLQRLENFLSLGDKHKIRAMPVLFDSCFDPQTVDLTGYRDRNWMPSPGFPRLGPKDRPAMEDYIHAVVGSHKDDRRIILWDVMNEPESTRKYGDLEHGGRQMIDGFVRWALQRVKLEKPSQPLTIGWAHSQANIAAIDLVDVICIHHYCPHRDLRRLIQEGQHWGRLYGKQVIMNEFVGQPQQPIERAVPIAAEQKIGWVFWELMLGKTQFTAGSAPYQGHIYPDGTCRSVREVAAILHPEGYAGDPRQIAAKAGFRPRSFTENEIAFEGGWQCFNGPGPTGGRLWHAGNPHDSATKTVAASTIAVVLKHGPDCGIAAVSIDGRPAAVAEIDAYAKEIDWNRRTVVARDLPAGPHTVVITATGRQAAASSHRLIQIVDIVGLDDSGKVGLVRLAPLYAELYRPQFHFSPRKNWTNDPNGMVFYKGEYHLFFQHNPLGLDWGNMTWGHAVSPDMFHWEQLDHAIRPDRLGTIFSGSAVVDWDNTAGFQKGDEKTIVCIYTSAGGTSAESKGRPFTQSIAYSTDRGRTFTKYEGNPVLEHIAGGNRDPKVFWHKPSKKWIMALFLDGNTYVLLSSPNLKEWTRLCDVVMPGSAECPDFFELPVDGQAARTRWVFWGANNQYVLGRFDGTTFTREAGPFPSHFGRNRYAAQTFSAIPPADGRRIQIAWMNGGTYPHMPFNQQMSLPVELSLHTFPEGVRLCTHPVKEVDGLHKAGKKSIAGALRATNKAWESPKSVAPKQSAVMSGIPKSGEDPLAGISGDLFDIQLSVAPGAARTITLNVRGTPILYDVRNKRLSLLGAAATVDLVEGNLILRVFVDRSSIEIFTADGRVNMACCFLPAEDDKTLSLASEGGDATIRSLDVWELNSAWPK